VICLSCKHLRGGLRISDLFKIRKESIDDLDNSFFLTLESEKTSKVLQYQLREETVNLLKKYNYNMQLIKNGQTYNIVLKKLAKHVGLNRKVIQLVGDISSDSIKKETFQIWELFSSKCARKAFISILYNAGVPVDKIARITRHSSDSINHYISVLEEVDLKTISTI
jgi:integrase